MIQIFFRDCNGFSKKCYASNLLNDFEGVLWVITGMSYYKPEIEQSEYNLELAKQELADAGYPNGFSTKIYANEMSNTMATFLQAELKKLNIEAEIENVDYTVIQGEYLSSKAATTGICCWGLMNPPTIQLDRFIKHMNYTATLGGSAIWTDEIKALWDATPTAMTQEEQDATCMLMWSGMSLRIARFGRHTTPFPATTTPTG